MDNLQQHPEYYNPEFRFEGEEFRRMIDARYSVSNYGRIRSNARFQYKGKNWIGNRILIPYLKKLGYHTILIRINRKRKTLLSQSPKKT